MGKAGFEIDEFSLDRDLFRSYKWGCMDALYYESWKLELKQHQPFEGLFMKINLFKLKNIKFEEKNFCLS